MSIEELEEAVGKRFEAIAEKNSIATDGDAVMETVKLAYIAGAGAAWKLMTSEREEG